MPSNTERANIIAQALDTPEGRLALSQSMTEPIRRALDYQGIGRQLLMVDELPQGAYANYSNRVTVPTFEIVANPTIRLSEMRGHRFYISPNEPAMTYDERLRYLAVQEEEIQNDYLLWTSEIKLENGLNSCRNKVKNAILQLELGD